MCTASVKRSRENLILTESVEDREEIRLQTKIFIFKKKKIIVDRMNCLKYIFLAVLYTEVFAGILVNQIILAAILLKWKTLRSLQTYYKILGCLVMSRSFYLSSVLFCDITLLFYPWILLDMVALVATQFNLMFFYSTHLWFATILCVFYCVKITSYNWKILIFLKTKLSKLVPWLLLASPIISLSCSFPFGFSVFYSGQTNFTNSEMPNLTAYNNRPIVDLKNQFFIFLLGSSPPFLIICVTICLILHSLWMHTRRMRSSGSAFRSPNLESHFSAVKNMTFFLVFQIMYIIAINTILSGRVYYNYVLRFVISIIAFSPFFSHSLYIISSNSDLKKTCISMFHVLTRRDH